MKQADLAYVVGISIHAPARGATTRTGTGCRWIYISIHAPARGATVYLSKAEEELFISIHAPARGATIRMRVESPNTLNFNPRSREGSDDIFCIICARIVYFNPRSREGSDFYCDLLYDE